MENEGVISQGHVNSYFRLPPSGVRIIARRGEEPYQPSYLLHHPTPLPAFPLLLLTSYHPGKHLGFRPDFHFCLLQLWVKPDGPVKSPELHFGFGLFPQDSLGKWKEQSDDTGRNG